MATVTFPRNGIPIGWANVGGQRLPVEIHPEYLRAFESLLQRVGGVVGVGTDELTLSQFEDAGIEESKQALFRLADEVGQAPQSVALPDDVDTQISDLREAVTALARMVSDLQQGAQ